MRKGAARVIPLRVSAWAAVLLLWSGILGLLVASYRYPFEVVGDAKGARLGRLARMPGQLRGANGDLELSAAGELDAQTDMPSDRVFVTVADGCLTFSRTETREVDHSHGSPREALDTVHWCPGARYVEYTVGRHHLQLWSVHLLWPLGAVTALVFAGTVLSSVQHYRLRRRGDLGLCMVCAYDVRRTQTARCPECGTPVAEAPKGGNDASGRAGP